MNHLIKSCLAAVFALAAFTVQAQTLSAEQASIEFNDQLTDISDSLYSRGQQWGSLFNEAYKSGNYANLKPARESMERFVNNSIARVKSMQDVKDSKALRMAMIQYLEFEKRMINDAFRPLEMLTGSSSKEELQAAFQNLKTLTESENAELQKVIDAQGAYAAANGFNIESEEEAGER